MKITFLFAFLCFSVMTAYCLEQNDDYYQLWRKYVDYFDPGNPPDIKNVLRNSGNTACIPSKEAQDIIKEGKSIIPYLITYTDKKSYFLKIRVIQLIEYICGWTRPKGIYNSNIDKYWENIKKKVEQDG